MLAAHLARAVLQANRHGTYRTDIVFNEHVFLHDFVVMRDVLRPELVASFLLAKHLAGSAESFAGRSVIDMGSGSGIQGVVMALKGATRVILTDDSPHAIENSKANVEVLELGDKVIVHKGDLFEGVESTADLIVFNHPFFPGQPRETDFIERSILDDGELIHRFLDDARNIAPRVIMPFLHVAGETNDPGIQGPRHGYKIHKQHRLRSTLELNPGDVSIYELASPGG